jgi:prefoldin subunit 5
MPEPKYLDSLRGEIAVVDRKIDDFNEKFDQKFDTLSENLHKVENALTEVSASLRAFVQRVDKAGDRQWQLFLGVIGLTVSFLAASAASFWQVQQHGKQLERLEKSVGSLDASVSKFQISIEKIPSLETSIDRLDKSVAGLEKSVEKIPSLEASIIRLDKSVVGLENSLEQHAKQLDKLEKSVERIAGLETSIVRLEVSVTRFAGLEKSLADLPALARSMDEFLKERRRELLLAGEIWRVNLPLNQGSLIGDDNKTQLKFEWELTNRQGIEIEAIRPAPAILRLLNGRNPLAEQAIELGTMSLPRLVFMGAPISTKVEVLGEGKKVRLIMEFRHQAEKERVLEHLVDRGINVEILVPTRPKP